QWQQGPAPFPLVFKRTEKAAVLNRPQEPKRPFPYDEKEVAYENKRDKVKLAGTLTLPRTPGPFPAVLLITGSGPQDRDESLMGHKPFLVLSDYLTRAGVAVLRVDDRGVGGSSRGGPDDTSENYTEDVLAGVEFLKSQKEINPRQIGLVGHSEGGMIAPMAAARSKDIAFIVLMAGPGLPGDKLLMMQSDLLMRAQSEEAFARYNAWFANILAISKSETDQAAAEKKMRQEVDRRVAEIAETQKQELATFRSMMEAQSKIFLSPWFRYFLNYDPRPTLMQVKIPVLAINGERDLQVPPREDLAAIEEALRAGGNSDFQTVLMPNLNHLFQTSRTGAPAEYGQIEETIAPVALKTIADWILKHTSARASSARQD
ncbi:MAG TPA: alpha/beta fold hydrolase, partial [Pyrinomonadaceae bacterium]